MTSRPLTEKLALEMVGKLAILRYFPAEPAARSVVVDLILSICRNESEADWLMRAMTCGLYNEWPGIAEMRACFCSRFPPKDGQECYSAIYLDGIPLPPQLAAPHSEAKLLPPGEPVSADPKIVKAVEIAAKLQDFKDTTGLGGPATPEEIQSAPEWLRRMEGYEV